ncbi:hypothetical protein [Pseudaquabacterium pictum]|uniref:Baseplate protein J-like domain-containing protein n=1 Tax=Pseudaquabacterium pictum TaxID=2315236 RepID=A0A480AHP9_9BURK|nr:hypothetical protein [Rubrivivax pictus]GCL60933.1 hypothetical protein AQPW35_00140 [Rubrivivax pictus]
MDIPLHDGSSQAARLRPALDPAHAVLDSWSLADALAFARAYAAGLVAVDDSGADQGHWQALFPPVDGLVDAADATQRAATDTAAPDAWPQGADAVVARPPLALLLACLDLIGLTRSQLNQFSGRHLDYFYRDVLRMVAQPAVADRVHLLAQPDSRLARVRVPAGTLLRAGQDAAGQPRLFSTRDDLVASQVRVAALCSLRVHIRETGIAQASRQYLQGGTRQQAFLAMLRIALGAPNPGDPLPLPIFPGLPADPAPGQPPAEIDFDTLVQAQQVVDFVATGLGMPLFDDFRRLMQLRAQRVASDRADWAAINALLAEAGRRRDAAYQPPAAAPDDFHANLRAALGLDERAYARLYDQLPEVARIEDVHTLLTDRPEVQAFVTDTLRLTLPEFRSLMQTKLRVDGQWREIVSLLEAAGRRLQPALALTAAQRGLRDVDALLALTHGRPAWPLPAVASLQHLHQSFIAIEQYFGLSAEAFRFMMVVARRSLALPPTVLANTPADDADWARVHALLTEAFTTVQVRRRQQALLAAAEPRLRARAPLQALAAMVALATGAPLPLEAAWSRLTALGMAAADLAWLQALAEAAEAGTAPAAADWTQAALLLEQPQRQRPGGALGEPVQRIWHHAYPAGDARAVQPLAPVAEGAAPRWQPFGNLATARQRQPAVAPVLGLAFASPLLALAEGQRQITLVLGFDGDAASFDARALRALLAPADAAPLVAGFNPFEVQLSGPEGWLAPADLQLAWLRPGFDGYPAVAGIETGSLRALVLRCSLGEQQPAVQPPSLAVHGLQAAAPVLRLMLRPAWHAGFACHHSDYQALAGLQLRRLWLQVRVTGLAGLLLQNDQQVLDPKKPFEPFGMQPASGARLSIAHPELVGKALDSISFRGSWMGAPVSLKTHYANYPRALSAADFTVRVGLRDGAVFNTTKDPLPLFGDGDSPKALLLQPAGVAEPGRLQTEPPAPAVAAQAADWRRAWVWELAGDLQHAAYPAQALRLSAQLASAMAAGSKPVAENFVVNPPYTPKLKSLVADYTASCEQAAVPPPFVPAGAAQPPAQLHHVLPFGQVALGPDSGAEPGSAVPLLPDLPAQGELYIGLAGVQAPQRLSLLVQVAEGSADPEAPPEPVHWSVLDGGRWRSLQQGALEGSLLADGTRQLVNAGIVELQLPAVAPGLQMAVAPLLDDQPPPPGGLLWLRLRRQRAVEGVCDLVGLHPNAVLAERVDAALTGDDLGRALPPGQVTGPLEPVPGLAALAQPYSSFGGRPAEQGALFNTRVAERLRHRQRALTPWDYEHLVLGQFPQLYKVKCLRADARWQPEPGAVDLIVVPDITQRQPFDPFAPRASAELIADITAFLADKLPASARLRVRNAHFIPVKVRCGVRFMPGTDEGWCRQQLNDDLNRFLSPWAYADGADLVIGGSLYANSILHYIETRPYVDYIAGLRLFTGDQGRFTLVPDQPVHAITPQRADAVLVAADQHEFDVIAANDQRVQGFEGIGSMRIELDFSIA